MKKITVAEFKAGATLPEPIYIEKPYIILNKDGVVLAAGSLDYLKADVIISRTSYYDDFEITARAHDLYMNDNTRLPANNYQI